MGASAKEASRKGIPVSYITFENVTKEYRTGSERVLAANNVNFEMEKGELCVVLGPSGAGKTTILNLLGGMDKATLTECAKTFCQTFPAQLSGGEQQRVSIARALCKNPALLLCDEPTGALDSKTGLQVLALLKEVSEKYQTTVAIITHNAAIAPLARRVIRVRNGQIESVTINETPSQVDEIAW